MVGCPRKGLDVTCDRGAFELDGGAPPSPVDTAQMLRSPRKDITSCSTDLLKELAWVRRATGRAAYFTSVILLSALGDFTAGFWAVTPFL